MTTSAGMTKDLAKSPDGLPFPPAVVRQPSAAV
jgi:hypothetical protein